MKRLMNIMAGSAVVSVALMLSLLSSCTLVEFTGDPINSFDDMVEVERSQTSPVSFEVEWPSNIDESEMPQYITVVMNRIQSSAARYVMHLDAFGNVLDSAEIPEDGTTDETPEDDETGDNDSPEDDGTEGEGTTGELDSEAIGPIFPAVKKGFYSIAAVAVMDMNDFIVPKIEEFADSLETSMRDVKVTIPQLTREEKVEKQYVDYNPVYPYIRTVAPIYYVRPSVKTHTEIWTERNEIKTVVLKPQPLTRKLTVKVKIDVEEGVKIDRLVGAFSGIPSEVQLMTGYVSDKHTGKVPFEFTSDDGKNFEGTIHIFGLFPPANEEQFAGPGILTLSIQASAEENGTKHSTIFYNNVNMKKEIEDAEIMILTEDRSAYRFSDTENTDNQGAYLEIKDFNMMVSDSNVDKITKYMVVSGKGQGFNKWIPVEGNDNKEENPGLNPEV